MLLTGLAVFAPLLAVILHATLGIKAGFHGVFAPPAIAALVIGLAAGIISLVLLAVMRLETNVTRAGIHVRFRPFHLKAKFYPFGEITSVEPVTCSPLRDYGGWGIRYGRKGWAYNVSGDRGVMLSFRDRGNLLVGSKRADEFAAVARKNLKPGVNTPV